LGRKFFSSYLQLVALNEDAMNLVSYPRKQFHIEGGVGKPLVGKWSCGPIGRGVFFGKAQAQHIFDNAL
jgi:hypothetical protein